MGEGRDATALAQHKRTEAAQSYQGSVQFLIFELQGQRYGVDVAAIEAIVQASALRGQEGSFSYEEEGVMAVHSLAQWVGLATGRESSTDRAPAADASRHLLLSRSGGGLYGLLVDMPRDIISLPLEAIHALPPLIRRLLAHSPLWGVGRTEEGLILLVDPAGRRPGTSSSGGQKGEPEEEL